MDQHPPLRLARPLRTSRPPAESGHVRDSARILSAHSCRLDPPGIHQHRPRPDGRELPSILLSIPKSPDDVVDSPSPRVIVEAVNDDGNIVLRQREDDMGDYGTKGVAFDASAVLLPPSDPA